MPPLFHFSYASDAWGGGCAVDAAPIFFAQVSISGIIVRRQDAGPLSNPTVSNEGVMNKQIVLNLPVKDLEKSKAFFTALGFSFNPQFSNDSALFMNIVD